MLAFFFNGKSARSGHINAVISAMVLSEQDHRLYSVYCLVLLGPLALADRGCPLAVTNGGVCWSSASDADCSSVASPGCHSAFDDFNGDCWPSESDDEFLDFAGSSSSSVSAPSSGTSESEMVASLQVGDAGCSIKDKAKHKSSIRTLSCHCVLENYCCIRRFGESTS